MKTACVVRGILFLGLIALLFTIPIKTDAGGLVNGSLVISEGSEQEVSPSIAYNSQRQEYLVVWYNDRAGCDDIRAQRLSANGELLGSPFYVSAGCNPDRRYPDVAYNSVHDQYLVVWEQNDISSGYSIKGRRIDGAGGVLDTVDIDIRSYGYNLYTPTKPAVAYASTSDRYLVVWAETWHPIPITYDIYGQVITSAGALEGSRFSISTNTSILEEPDVAYNRHANRYLVVWQNRNGALCDIYAQQVHGDGGLFQSPITIAYFTAPSTNPSVAAIPTTPTNTKFMVIWQLLYATNDHDIYYRLIEEDGTAKNIVIFTDTYDDDTNPTVTGSEDTLHFFVAWRHPQGVVDNPIKGQLISYDGTVASDIVDFSGVNADLPVLASGATGDILAAWQDQPVSATNTNIYGQVWGNRVYLPLIIRN